MHTPPVHWYFDFISPFAYLHWPKVRTLMNEVEVTPVPILFAAVLDARGQKGPAEIPGKREFTYRHVLWQARQAGVNLQFPPTHPFNPLAALRLCIAAKTTPAAVDAIFRWIWDQGRAVDTPQALEPLCEELGLEASKLVATEVKSTLRDNTEAALAVGVFGVPTLAIGKHLFWGNDAHEFAVATLRDPALMEDPQMRRVEGMPLGVQRGS